MSQLTQWDLAKTALLDNFDALTADPSRIPPIVKGTATRWEAGKYPQNCYDKAREAISDEDARPKCELRDLEIYDVTYEDCPSGRDPWDLCRCSNAELSLQDTIDGMGTVPPGARSYVLHIITMNGFGGGGGYSDSNSIFCGGLRPKPGFPTKACTATTEMASLSQTETSSTTPSMPTLACPTAMQKTTPPRTLLRWEHTPTTTSTVIPSTTLAKMRLAWVTS
ncbi:hypothetical protein BU23DRAFT_556448 [Bimuria novae-zelandiae CBS 107.79]|uniref:Uncharacterized protein n=1 Tax=Bimuria novae-zelandiae CBS 107.79 TaxID=1447943 RepID=A0A6A5V3U0_9PLEO|nr:hypothetical protein BU23DRAFT_556448 [Bimuria novae-zelandiae CBS 107.79]